MFDGEPDHGLRDPMVRAAWASTLLPHLPVEPARVADLGCGTGSVALLLAEAGHHVHGLDLAPRMIAAARSKATAAGARVTFDQGDISDPELDPGSFEVVFARHVLWALPDPGAALRRWARLLRPGGRFVLVEGRWHTGVGLTAERCRELVGRLHDQVVVHRLDDPRLWGGPVEDERYLLRSRR